VSYCADGLITTHNADFLRDPLFGSSYAKGIRSGHRISSPEDLHIEWRVYVCCWAGWHAARLDGHFVECGVSTGVVSLAVANYVNFAHTGKKFFLFDTFSGIPSDQIGKDEQLLAESKNQRHYFDSFELVKKNFSEYKNVKVIRGKVPQSLGEISGLPISYLHIDMNIAYPEVAASEILWEQLTPGAIVIYDDYASTAHLPQKVALDTFASKRGVRILSLPTGQGMLIKSNNLPTSATTNHTQ
jgi:hypothetical protein